MRIIGVFGALSLFLIADVLAGQAQAAKPVATPTAQTLDPCCAITSIDGETGIVTARVTVTGRMLAFKVTDAALLRSLRIGQTIIADFPAKRVSIKPAETCCAIVSADVPAGAATAVIPPQAPAAPGAPAGLGTHPYEVDGVEVVLISVQRSSGNTLTVRWQYRNTTSQPRQIGGSFRGMGWSEPFSLVYDAYIVDDSTKYPVLKDTAGNLVAAQHGAGKVVTLAAKGTHANQ